MSELPGSVILWQNHVRQSRLEEIGSVQQWVAPVSLIASKNFPSNSTVGGKRWKYFKPLKKSKKKRNSWLLKRVQKIEQLLCQIRERLLRRLFNYRPSLSLGRRNNLSVLDYTTQHVILRSEQDRKLHGQILSSFVIFCDPGKSF